MRDELYTRSGSKWRTYSTGVGASECSKSESGARAKVATISRLVEKGWQDRDQLITFKFEKFGC